MATREPIPIEVQYDETVLDKVEKLGRFEGFTFAIACLCGLSIVGRKLRNKKAAVENEES